MVRSSSNHFPFHKQKVTATLCSQSRGSNVQHSPGNYRKGSRSAHPYTCSWLSSQQALKVKVKVTQSAESLQPHGLYSPWDSPGRNTGVGSLSLLQGIFPTQGLNPGLLHCRQILYQLSHKESTRILEWVAYPFSSGSSQPRNWVGISRMQENSLPREPIWSQYFLRSANSRRSFIRQCHFSWHRFLQKNPRVPLRVPAVFLALFSSQDQDYQGPFSITIVCGLGNDTATPPSNLATPI